jgi:hypothetical protein
VDVTWEATEQTIRAIAEVEKAGLEFAPRPEDESPVLPEDPTLLDDSELMSLMRRFVAWSDFSATQSALAEVDERMYDSLLQQKEEIVLLRTMPTSEALRKREDTITRVKAEVQTHHEVVDLRDQRQTAYMRRKLMNVTFERYDRDAAFLSRELTRRTGGQDPKQRRVGRWAT